MQAPITPADGFSALTIIMLAIAETHPDKAELASAIRRHAAASQAATAAIAAPAETEGQRALLSAFLALLERT